MRRSLGGATLRLLDVATLVTAVVLRRSTEANVAPFADDVLALDPPPTSRDPVLATLDRLGALPIGNTRCPLERLVPASFDLLVVVSDALVDLAQWDAIRAASPDARLVVVDLRRFPRPLPYRPDVLHVTGFSDSVFDVLAPFARGDLEANHLRTIESVVL
jgi:60 kDa SS-A/Ro ribonucleoprotein